MLKKRLSFLACLVALLMIGAIVPEAADAFKLPIPGQEEEKEGGAELINIDDVKSEYKSIKRLVSKATSYYLLGSAKVMGAVGEDKEKAAEFQGVAEDLKKNPEDSQKIKDANNNYVDKGNEFLKEINIKQPKISADKKKDLRLGSIYVGTASILDGLAVNRTSKFLKKLEKVMKDVKKDKTLYFKNKKMLDDACNLTTFLAETLPTQVTAISDTFAGLIKLASANNVSVSRSDAKKEAEKME